jgi:hypothetical protein
MVPFDGFDGMRSLPFVLSEDGSIYNLKTNYKLEKRENLSIRFVSILAFSYLLYRMD